MPPIFIKNTFILIAKEFKRLKHNPSALMAVGLLILMAVLVNIETKSQQNIARKDARTLCQVVYDTETDLIAHLKRNKNPNVPVNFVKSTTPVNSHTTIQYANNINCAAEISFEPGKPQRIHITFRNNAEDQTKLHGFSRWLLSGMAAFYSGLSIEQSIQPFKFEKMQKPSTGFNLGNAKSKATVGAMLIFSAQFFICVALFISLSASEKEKGVLQALSLTTASTTQILFAKVLFHLILSLTASFLMIGILKSRWIFMPTAWWMMSPILIFSSLCLTAVATLVVSFNKTQTAASLMGFCYLMLVGVVFALAQNFVGFAALKQLMFENHVISIYGMLFDETNLTRQESVAHSIRYIGHLVALTIITPILLGISAILWNKIGCKSR